MKNKDMKFGYNINKDGIIFINKRKAHKFESIDKLISEININLDDYVIYKQTRNVRAVDKESLLNMEYMGYFLVNKNDEFNLSYIDKQIDFLHKHKIDYKLFHRILYFDLDKHIKVIKIDE